MARRKCSRYSGIGGQAVLEGVMMKNNENYAVAVRKPDGEIAVERENYQGVLHGSKGKQIPFLRGIFVFLDSLILGMRCLNFSASFYEEEGEKKGEGGAEKVMTALVTVFSVALALGIFVVLPYYLASLFQSYVRNASLMAIIEGAIRIAVFLIYICGISLMKDIRLSRGGTQVHQLHRERAAPDGAQCDAKLQAAQKMRHQLSLLCRVCEYPPVLLYPGGQYRAEGSSADPAHASDRGDFL